MGDTLYDYRTLVARLDDQVRRSFRRQVLDGSRPDDGAFYSDHPDVEHWMTAAHDTSLAGYALLCEDSVHFDDDALLDRVLRAIAYQRRCQNPTGLVDLQSTNWDSAPDTAFTLLHLLPLLAVADRQSEADMGKAKVIADELSDYVLPAAKGIIGRGFHTANHRWVVAAALAMSMNRFPEVQAGEYLENILAETIDMNADGEYTERSTGIYNAVCDRSLRYLADALGKPEYLDYVRRNLNMMVRLLHDDWTVVTGLSVRDDHGQRVVPSFMADSFYDMARRDGNGVWATVADELIDRADDLTWLMQPFMLNPDYREESVERLPVPGEFVAGFPTARIWRVRRGKLSATAAAGTTTAFELKYGEAHLKAVKVCGSYFGIAQFSGETYREVDGGVEMTHVTAAHRRPSYDLPLGRPVPWGTFNDVAAERDTWPLEPFTVTLGVREAKGGFDVSVRTEGGVARVPFQIEFCFDGPGHWETSDCAVEAANGQTAILKAGTGTFRRGLDAISISPGAAAHRAWHMRGNEPEPGVFRALLTYRSPVDAVVHVRYGDWSVADSAIIG